MTAMSRFIGLIITVVAVAALVGAAIGWQFPFLGGNRSANQLRNSTENTGTGTRPGNRARVQPANPQNAQADNTERTAQAPSNTPIDPERPNTGTTETDTGSANQNEPINALW